MALIASRPVQQSRLSMQRDYTLTRVGQVLLIITRNILKDRKANIRVVGCPRNFQWIAHMIYLVCTRIVRAGSIHRVIRRVNEAPSTLASREKCKAQEK